MARPFLFLILFFSHLQNLRANEYHALVLGERFYLEKQKDYHFSDIELIEPHTNLKPPFVVALKKGLLSFKNKNTKSKLLILTKSQKKFFDKTNFLVEASPFLDWSFKKNNLIVEGKTLDESEESFLLKECSALHSPTIKIALQKRLTPQNYWEKTCLSTGLTGNEYVLSLALSQIEKNRRRSYGLGSPFELPWLLEGQKINFSEVSGTFSAGSEKRKNIGELFFSGKISSGSPIEIENGVEVGMTTGGLLKRDFEWKKATSKIAASLVSSDLNSSKIRLEVTNSQRTGETQVFRSDKIKKSLNLFFGEWTSVLKFQKAHQDQIRGGLFSWGLLGSLKKSNAQSHYELWLRLDKDHEY